MFALFDDLEHFRRAHVPGGLVEIKASPTIVLYGKNRQAPDLLVGDFAGAFTNADGML